MADQASIEKLRQMDQDPEFIKLPPDRQKMLVDRLFSVYPNNQPPSLAPTYQSGQSTPFKRSDSDFIIDMLRPIVSGFAGNAVEEISGPYAPVAGPATYATIDGLLQKLKSKQDRGLISGSAGLEEGSIGSNLVNSGENLVGGKLAEGAIKGGIKLVKAFNSSNVPEITKLAPTTSQLADEGSLLSKTSRFIEDNFAAGSKRTAQVNSAQLAGKEAKEIASGLGNSIQKSRMKNPVDMFNAIANDIPVDEYYTPITVKGLNADYTPLKKLAPREEPFTQFMPKGAYVKTMPAGPIRQTPTGSKIVIPGETVEKAYAENYKQLDDVINDPKRLQQMLVRNQSTGSVNQNLRNDLKSYKFMRSWQDATETDAASGNIKVNAQKLRDSFFGTSDESLATIYNKQNRADIEQFIKNVARTQEGPNTSRLFRYVPGGIVLTSSLLSGHLSAGSAATGALYLGANQLGKLLTKPTTARLLVNIVGGQPLGMSETYAARLLVNALQGAGVAISNDDGSYQAATVKDGRIEARQ